MGDRNITTVRVREGGTFSNKTFTKKKPTQII